MPKLSVNKYSILVLCLLGSMAQASTVKKQQTLSFDQVFKAKGEAQFLNYQAQYTSAGGQTHQLEVWRSGQDYLRRKTDQRIDNYVIREKADPSNYQMIVVDYQKRITTKVNRNNLLHLGHLSDWFDMAHGLRHPTGTYQLSMAQSPDKNVKPIDTCQWYMLKQNGLSHHICWSSRQHLPLEIWDEQQKKSVWHVQAISNKHFGREVFKLHDQGFLRNDANDDIEND